ncbi:hypothetical protein CC86DRAFT_378095 [Ophiobolus disseminans]|uniref:Uncharacterized protein n=1 Tax=Ophiobolus disseminans TaxID=1469910 RepID=A0A6A7AD20_9PLEO|nr:hypothetical protein CC86DRAFT_378095 [Ophiobolus disseminans]
MKEEKTMKKARQNHRKLHQHPDRSKCERVTPVCPACGRPHGVPKPKVPSAVKFRPEMRADNAKISERSQRISPLLRLPGELRNIIYKSLFDKELVFNGIYWPTKPKEWLALLLTCRMLYDETVLLPFRHCTFQFHSLHIFQQTLPQIQLRQRKAIRKKRAKQAEKSAKKTEKMAKRDGNGSKDRKKNVESSGRSLTRANPEASAPARRKGGMEGITDTLPSLRQVQVGYRFHSPNQINRNWNNDDASCPTQRGTRMIGKFWTNG